MSTDDNKKIVHGQEGIIQRVEFWNRTWEIWHNRNNGKLMNIEVSVQKPDGSIIPNAFLPRGLIIDGVKHLRQELWDKIGTFFDAEEFCQYRHHYGLRTKAYIESIYSNLSLIDKYWTENYGGWENDKAHGFVLHEGLQPVNVYNAPALNASEIEVYLIDNKYYARYTVAFPGGYTPTFVYIFSEKPKEKAIKTATKVQEIEGDFTLRLITENFECWECGRFVHWLDSPGDIWNKHDNAKERYCGC